MNSDNTILLLPFTAMEELSILQMLLAEKTEMKN
jgi:hypothetical protein